MAHASNKDFVILNDKTLLYLLIDNKYDHRSAPVSNTDWTNAFFRLCDVLEHCYCRKTLVSGIH